MKMRISLVAFVNVPAQREFAARSTSHGFMATVMSTFPVPSPPIK
jgi:hypothetical protein